MYIKVYNILNKNTHTYIYYTPNKYPTFVNSQSLVMSTRVAKKRAPCSSSFGAVLAHQGSSNLLRSPMGVDDFMVIS